MSKSSDPYQILGVDRKATEAEIKSAYRKLAKKYHPDLNKDNVDHEKKFKEISLAYEILGNKEKRGKFDRGEIDASGQESAYAFNQGFRGARNTGSGGEFDFSEIFGGMGDDFFSAAFGQGAAGQGGPSQGKAHSSWRSAFGAGASSGARQKRYGPQPEKGKDIHYTLKIGFQEAVLGGKRQITLADGKKINITIPIGTEHGQKLRLKGRGSPSEHPMGSQGDALIELHVASHPVFERRGSNLYLTLPITVQEAVEGTKIDVPTLTGKVSLRIPQGSNTGQVLRLKSKGVPAHHKNMDGDLMVRLEVQLDDPKSEAWKNVMKHWPEDQHGQRIRKKFDDL